MNPPRMLTFSEPDFLASCEQATQMTKDFGADVVVGIATGGAHVAGAMVSRMEPRPALVTARLSRPGTSIKRRVRGDLLLRRLPRSAAYYLRWFEVALRESSLKSDVNVPPATDILQDAPEREAVRAGARILIVDDTVDSGRTLKAVEQAVRHYNPHCETRSVVLASTWKCPPVVPDYVLHPRTLIQFHWSMDR